MLTGSLVLTFSGHSSAVSGVIEHPTNFKQLVTSSLDGTIRGWDVDDAACLYTINIGLPVTHLCAPSSTHSKGVTCADGALVYAAVACCKDSTKNDYPLGNEVACLRPRPLATAFAFTVTESGRRRLPPNSFVVEVDLVLRTLTRRIGRGQGFIVGIEGRRSEQGDATVVFAMRRRLYVWRSTRSGTFLCIWNIAASFHIPLTLLPPIFIQVNRCRFTATLIDLRLAVFIRRTHTSSPETFKGA